MMVIDEMPLGLLAEAAILTVSLLLKAVPLTGEVIATAGGVNVFVPDVEATVDVPALGELLDVPDVAGVGDVTDVAVGGMDLFVPNVPDVAGTVDVPDLG